MKLRRCRCGGFVPQHRATCPHCKSGVLGRLGLAAVGGAIAFTLMACYGRPPCKDGTRNCYAPPNDASSQDATPDSNPDAK